MEQCQLVFSAEAINVWGAWIVVRQLRDLLSIHVLLRSALDEKERLRGSDWFCGTSPPNWSRIELHLSCH